MSAKVKTTLSSVMTTESPSNRTCFGKAELFSRCVIFVSMVLLVLFGFDCCGLPASEGVPPIFLFLVVFIARWFRATESGTRDEGAQWCHACEDVNAKQRPSVSVPIDR